MDSWKSAELVCSHEHNGVDLLKIKRLRAQKLHIATHGCGNPPSTPFNLPPILKASSIFFLQIFVFLAHTFLLKVAWSGADSTL